MAKCNYSTTVSIGATELCSLYFSVTSSFQYHPPSLLNIMVLYCLFKPSRLRQLRTLQTEFRCSACSTLLVPLNPHSKGCNKISCVATHTGDSTLSPSASTCPHFISIAACYFLALRMRLNSQRRRVRPPPEAKMYATQTAE